MTSFLFGLAAILVVNLAVGLIRVVRGPTAGDRMIAAQLFGTNGVAVLLVLAEATGESALRDVALVVTLLAVVVTVTYVKRGWLRREPEGWEGAAADPSDRAQEAG